MKKKCLSLLLVAVMLIGLLTGCGSTKKIVASETYEVEKNPSMTVDGTWMVPGKDRELRFQADGTYTSTISKTINGSYTYYKNIEGFKLADSFQNVEYVVLSDSEGEEQIFGAVLGDILVGYWNQDSCYYFREDREIIPEEKFVGSWSSGKYNMVFHGDGTGKAGDKDELQACTYQYDTKTGYLTITQDDKDTQYAVGMYEGYLFLMLVGNYYTMYMFQPTE